jgi:hypothetical protein
MNAREQEQAEEQAAFEQAFASATGIDLPAPTAASTDAAAGANDQSGSASEAGTEAAANATAPDASDAALAEANGEAAGTTPAADPAAEEDPVLLDGLKRSELRRLFSNAADVEGLRKQLDKAHGSIGDLNRRLQQAQTAPRPAPVVPPEIQQFEQAYPEFAAYVKAMGIVPQQPQEAPPADPMQAVATDAGVPAQAEPDPTDIELIVMDRMHKGWREKIASPDFKVWLAGQPDDVRNTFDTATVADELSAVVGKFDAWSAARETRQSQGRSRLERAITPSGNAPRPQAAPTEEEAMRAAFAATIGRR